MNAKLSQKLVEALKLAEPGGLIRMFVDLGPDMARLLERLTDNETVSDYAQKLLVEFKKFDRQYRHLKKFLLPRNQ